MSKQYFNFTDYNPSKEKSNDVLQNFTNIKSNSFVPSNPNNVLMPQQTYLPRSILSHTNDIDSLSRQDKLHLIKIFEKSLQECNQDKVINYNASQTQDLEKPRDLSLINKNIQSLVVPVAKKSNSDKSNLDVFFQSHDKEKQSKIKNNDNTNKQDNNYFDKIKEINKNNIAPVCKFIARLADSIDLFLGDKQGLRSSKESKLIHDLSQDIKKVLPIFLTEKLKDQLKNPNNYKKVVKVILIKFLSNKCKRLNNADDNADIDKLKERNLDDIINYFKNKYINNYPENLKNLDSKIIFYSIYEKLSQSLKDSPKEDIKKIDIQFINDIYNDFPHIGKLFTDYSINLSNAKMTAYHREIKGRGTGAAKILIEALPFLSNYKTKCINKIDDIVKGRICKVSLQLKEMFKKLQYLDLDSNIKEMSSLYYVFYLTYHKFFKMLPSDQKSKITKGIDDYMNLQDHISEFASQIQQKYKNLRKQKSKFSEDEAESEYVIEPKIKNTEKRIKLKDKKHDSKSQKQLKKREFKKHEKSDEKDYISCISDEADSISLVKKLKKDNLLIQKRSTKDQKDLQKERSKSANDINKLKIKPTIEQKKFELSDLVKDFKEYIISDNKSTITMIDSKTKFMIKCTSKQAVDIISCMRDKLKKSELPAEQYSESVDDSMIEEGQNVSGQNLEIID